MTVGEMINELSKYDRNSDVFFEVPGAGRFFGHDDTDNITFRVKPSYTTFCYLPATVIITVRL